MSQNILVINSGSTSLKYKLFDVSGNEIKREKFLVENNHEKIIKKILREVGDVSDISAVGHRIVHGGEDFVEPVIINENILERLEKINNLAPLHNPYNLLGIKIISEFLPNTPQVAVFDTAFFSNIPEKARVYAIPDDLAERYSIKRYGFHGISHNYIAHEAAQELGKPLSKLNLITCHLGGGWSITAIKNGKPIDTSMGFTPLEGLVMMTRAGDIGSGVVFEILREGIGTQNDIEKLYDILNNNSGIKGLSGGIDDYQVLLREMNLGNKKARLAFNVATYRLSKYIGAYFVALGGKLDAIVFSGGIGAGDSVTRNEIINNTKFLGKHKNISFETNEEALIARETRKLVD
ncbi:MAG: acetate/propionate family kinase [Patescibacteria group bacterium]|jgi:acetate kinase|nr:acetate/propionate family kinase [Patescibacteria group bacterium]